MAGQQQLTGDGVKELGGVLVGRLRRRLAQD